jgi:hypothetical protein
MTCIPLRCIWHSVPTIYVYVGSEVLTAASMMMAVLWVIMPCSLVGVNQGFNVNLRLVRLLQNPGSSVMKSWT